MARRYYIVENNRTGRSPIRHCMWLGGHPHVSQRAPRLNTIIHVRDGCAHVAVHCTTARCHVRGQMPVHTRGRCYIHAGKLDQVRICVATVCKVDVSPELTAHSDDNQWEAVMCACNMRICSTMDLTWSRLSWW